MSKDASSWRDEHRQRREAGSHEKGGECPVCDLELDDDLPYHLPECPALD